jgi:hypothetical protein
LFTNPYNDRTTNGATRAFSTCSNTSAPPFKSSVPRAFRYHALLTILLPLRRFFGEVDGSDIALWTLYPSRRLLSARVSFLGTRLAPSKARARSEENSIFCARSISTTARTSASPQGQARPGRAVRGWAGDRPASRQDGVGQACRPYLSVTAAATNFLRPALPGLVPWAAHQSGNVAGSM